MHHQNCSTKHVKTCESFTMCITFEYGVPAWARTKSTINESWIILPVEPQNHHMCNRYKDWSKDCFFYDNIRRPTMTSNNGKKYKTIINKNDFDYLRFSICSSWQWYTLPKIPGIHIDARIAKTHVHNNPLLCRQQ